jgi:hypothetical protein
MRNCYYILLLLLFISCKTNEKVRVYNPPKALQTINFRMPAVLVSCSKSSNIFPRVFVAKSYNKKDSLELNVDLDFCDVYRDHLDKGYWVRSLIHLASNSDGLRYYGHQYQVFNAKDSLIAQVSGNGNGFKVPNVSLDNIKKTVSYKMKHAQYNILSSPISVDSIGTIDLLTEVRKN